MEDEGSEEMHQTSPFRARRRTRRDSGDRSFKCGCGKDYLSYPALYTHIKQKHDGMMPTGTDAPAGVKGRGRPRRLLSHGSHKTNDDSKDELLLEEGMLGGPCDPIAAYDLCRYPGTEDDKEIDRLFATLKVVSQDQFICPEVPTCDQVFALYLLDLAQKVTEDGYEQIVRFLRHLRLCLNQKGWTLPGETQTVPEGVYCELRPAAFLPEVSNLFITDYLEELEDPTSAPDRDTAIHLMMHFNGFLFGRRLSNLKLSLAPSE